MDPTTILVALADYWWPYTAFTLFVLAMPELDLGVLHRDTHELKFKAATGWSVVCGVARASLAPPLVVLLVAIPATRPVDHRQCRLCERRTRGPRGIAVVPDRRCGREEPVDRRHLCHRDELAYFAILQKCQHRVRFFGISGAIAFRAIFVGLGLGLMALEWVVSIAGAFLVRIGVKMWFAPEKGIEPSRNPAMRLLRRAVPITQKYEEERHINRIGGVAHATPLFVALVFVEVTDVVFAIHSVAAIFALTPGPLVVITPNIAAVLGLRACCILLAGLVDKLHLLKRELALVLVVVGLEMVWLNEAVDGKFPIAWSLGIIGGAIATAIGASFLFPRRTNAAEPAALDRR